MHYPQSMGFQDFLGNTATVTHLRESIRAGRFPRYVYLPHGPTATSDEAMSSALVDTVSAARERSLDFVRAEPAGPGAAAALLAMQIGRASCRERV